jgi:hypothetical protein
VELKQKTMNDITINSNYIYQDEILSRIYVDAVKKFMPIAERQMCFKDICDYIGRKLHQRKQCHYSHSLAVIKEVCQKVNEDFNQAVEYIAPNATCYRDIYYQIY